MVITIAVISLAATLICYSACIISSRAEAQSNLDYLTLRGKNKQDK